jgi:hypothetical protein
MPKLLRDVLPLNAENPWRPLLFLSGYAGQDDTGRSLYTRSWKVRIVSSKTLRSF